MEVIARNRKLEDGNLCKDREGKSICTSYNPPRYEYYYDFYIIISVNVPYFTEMKFKLNDGRVHISYYTATNGVFGSGLFQSIHEESMYDVCYRNYREMSDEICNLLVPGLYVYGAIKTKPNVNV